MKGTVRFRLGKSEYTFEIEESSDMQTLLNLAVLGNPPQYCQVCQNKEHFKLDGNKDKDGNIYLNVVCMASGCYSKAKIGQYKTGGYFWHKFEKYVKPGGELPSRDVNNEGMDDNKPF